MIKKISVQESDSGNKVKELVAAFRSGDGAQRLVARQRLVGIGKSIIPYLTDHLTDKNERVRWEIAKTLKELKTPTAASAMVQLLMDDVPGIRWLAGEGLIHLREDALPPLMKGLERNFPSSFFREGVHHVLREFEREGLLNAKGLEVIRALEGPAPDASAPVAAIAALRSIDHVR